GADRLGEEDLARHRRRRGLRALRRHRRDRRGDRRRRLLSPRRAGQAHRRHGRADTVFARPRGSDGAERESRRRRGQGPLQESLMATSVIMPALELAQETGKVIRWLKAPGDAVVKGEPLLEIETDKVTTEIEAPVSGILMHVSAQEGDVIPVGQAIAQIGAPGEAGVSRVAPASVASPAAAIKASPLARKIAEQHGVDLVQVKTSTGKIEKADVLAYVEARTAAPA